MFPKKNRLLLPVIFMIIASLVLTACGAGGGGEASARFCDDGLEGETITYYAQAGLTGPLASILGTAFVNALNDAIDQVNSDGGICGVGCCVLLSRETACKFTTITSPARSKRTSLNSRFTSLTQTTNSHQAAIKTSTNGHSS